MASFYENFSFTIDIMKCLYERKYNTKRSRLINYIVHRDYNGYILIKLIIIFNPRTALTTLKLYSKKLFSIFFGTILSQIVKKRLMMFVMQSRKTPVDHRTEYPYKLQIIKIRVFRHAQNE